MALSSIHDANDYISKQSLQTAVFSMPYEAPPGQDTVFHPQNLQTVFKRKPVLEIKSRQIINKLI